MELQRVIDRINQTTECPGPHEVSKLLAEAAAKRALLQGISNKQAQVLVKLLHQSWPPELEMEIKSSCSLLLAKWCRQQHQPADSGDVTAMLRQITHEALQIAAMNNNSAGLACSTCILLSCIALASEELASACRESICRSFCLEKHLLLESPNTRELIAFTGRLALQSQDGQEFIWWVALLLQLWDLPPDSWLESKGTGWSEGIHTVLAQITALYNSMRTTAFSLVQHKESFQPHNTLASLVELIQATQESYSRGLQSAGVVAGAALLEGCCKSAAASDADQLLITELGQLVADACARSLVLEPGIPVLQQAAAFASAQSYTTCGQPEVTEAVVICSFTAFTSAVLSIEGLFRAAAESEPAEIANRRLSMMLANPLMQGSTGFANHLATLYRLAQETTQQDVRQLLGTAVRGLAVAYGTYVTATPPSWLQAVDNSRLRQVLQRSFTSSVLLLAAIWEAYKLSSEAEQQDISDQKARLAAWVLDQLALLQFSRLRLNIYSDLLAEVYTVAARSREACSLLLGQLPCYSDLVQAYDVPWQEKDKWRWELDYSLAAEMQFRMQLLGPCTPLLEEGVVLHRLVPIVSLYLMHPVESAVFAAHALYCAILSRVSEKEQLAPFYIRRALDNYPGATPMKALTLGLDALLRHLPDGSPAKLFCLKKVCGHTLELATRKLRSELVMGLVHLQVYIILILDVQLLEDALSMVSETMAALPPSLQAEAKTAASRIVGSSDDVVRKVWLVRWLHEL